MKHTPLLKFRYRGVTVRVERVCPFAHDKSVVRWFVDEPNYVIHAINKSRLVVGDVDLYGDVLRFVDDCILAEGI